MLSFSVQGGCCLVHYWPKGGQQTFNTESQQESKCLIRSILLLPVQNRSRVRLKKDRHAQIDSGSMHDEERGFDKMADFVENGTISNQNEMLGSSGFKI